MHRTLVVCVMFAGLVLPLGTHEAFAMAQDAREADGKCFQRIAACVETCDLVEDEADDGCIDNCLRADACETESHRLSRSKLPDSDLPKSSMPDSSLQGDKLPQSRLP